MDFARAGLSQALRLAVCYPYRWGVGFLPPARELGLAKLVGATLSGLDSAVRSRVEQNLQRVFPGRLESEALASAWVAQRAAFQMLSISFEKLNRSSLSYYLSFEGLARLEEALARGRGCILTFPHLGPTLLPLFGLGLLGYSLVHLTVPELPTDSSPATLAAFHVQRYLESLVPATVLDARSYLRHTLRRLHQNQVVVLPCDGSGLGQEVGRRMPVRLLGQTVQMPVGAVYLALRAQAPLLPMVTLPGHNGLAYRTVLEPALELHHKGALPQTLRYHLQGLAERLEPHLREHPTYWHLWPDFEPGKMLAELPTR
ncbi:MAG: hypothetical protein ACKO6N_09390 [Myxococcota bacterium]